MRVKSLVGLIIVVCGALWYGYYRYQKVHQNTGKIRNLILNEPLPPNIPPASCPEWQTQSPPTYSYPPGRKCKYLDGKSLCERLGYSTLGCCDVTNAGLNGVLDIGPISGKTQVGQPITVYFRLRGFGSGDATVYAFGKVDWGDNQQVNFNPSPNGVPLSHTYYSQRTFIIHAMAGAQFKYSTPQVGGVSGSYEGCQDNSIPVTVTP